MTTDARTRVIELVRGTLAFQDEFGIDLAELEFDRYFLDESDLGFWRPLTLFAGICGFHRRPPYDITVGHLVAVVESGRWFDTDLRSAP